MNLSPEKQTHLVHVIVDGLWKDDLVDFTDDGAANRAGKRGMSKFVKELEEVDLSVVQTIRSLKRGVTEGSPEWDILYSKYFDDEMKRRGN